MLAFWMLLVFFHAAAAILRPPTIHHLAKVASVTSYDRNSTNSSEPCRVLSDAYKASNSTTDDAVAVSVPPSVGTACLKSVPVDKARDLALLDYLTPYISFQSTIEVLADPPEGYLLPGVDILGGLDKIKQKLENDTYDSQYSVMLDLQSLFVVASDGHFNYFPAILNTIAYLRRLLDLVSISEDGLQVPEIYLGLDVDPDIFNGNDSRVSPLESIDGTPVIEFLEQDAIYNIANYQDPDAQFNALFASVPRLALGQGGSLSYSTFEIPDNYTLKFRNGTSLVIQNHVVFFPGVNFTEVDNGTMFQNAFEIPSLTTSTQSPTSTTGTGSSATSTTAAPTVSGYPSPIAKEDSGAVAAYFLDDDGYTDTAILAILSFLPVGVSEADLTDDDVLDFIKAGHDVVVKLAHAAKEAKRDKLVIDLSANGGGSVELAIEVYRLLFPNGDMTLFDRMRANEALASASRDDYKGMTETILDDQHFPLDAEGKQIKKGDDFIGPYDVENQNVTVAFVDDFSKPLGDSKTFYYNGYDPNNPPSIAKAPFDPENILIVTDGTCASACNILTGLLTRTFGVRTLALGGRPFRLPMQAMGGTKGTEVNQFSEFQADFAQIKIKNSTATYIPSQEGAPLLPFIDEASSGASVNSHSGYTVDDLEGYPVQFRYEAAHCRLFYTASMVANVTETWRRVADIAWGNGTCVLGSTTNANGTIGNDTVGYNATVLSRAKPMPGPGTLSSGSNTTSNSNSTIESDQKSKENVANSQAHANTLIFALLIFIFSGLVII